MEKSSEALKIARKYTLFATAAGAVPVLGVDLAAVTALQVKMIADMATVYDIPFKSGRARTLVVGVLGSFTAFSHGVPGWLAARHGWLMPVGVVLKPIYSSIVTYAIANVFILHFERGGTLENFNPLGSDVRQAMKDAVEKAASFVTGTGKAATNPA